MILVRQLWRYHYVFQHWSSMKPLIGPVLTGVQTYNGLPSVQYLVSYRSNNIEIGQIILARYFSAHLLFAEGLKYAKVIIVTTQHNNNQQQHRTFIVC